MRRVLVLLSLGLVLAPAADAAAPATGRLLVTLTPAAAESRPSAGAAAHAVAAAAGAVRTGYTVPQIRLVTMRPRAGESPGELRRRLRADPRVSSVQPERRATIRYLPNDPALAFPETAEETFPGTTVEWWAVRAGFPLAWDITRGEGATIAVIDTGADATHPELAGRIAGARSFDLSGANAGVDDVGHGTHVASIACAAGDDGIAMAGAALRCRLLVIRSDLTDSSVAASIVWAADNGADAINMSFGTAPGTTPSQAVVAAVDYAVARGVLLVAAAADDPVQDQGYPASILQPTGSGPDLLRGKGLTVTAADYLDRRASFAGLGSQISLAAYGTYQPETGPRGIFGAFTTAQNALEKGGLGRRPCRCRTAFAGDPRYAYLEGTSMATPMVTAAGALVSNLNPDLAPAEVAEVIKRTARRPPGTGWSADLGWGILDAGAALVAARTIDRRPPVSKVRRLQSRVRSTTITVRWGGRDIPPPGVAASGVIRYELWRSANGRPAQRVLSTRRTSTRLKLRRGSRYAFFSIATDRAGNREAAPATPDTSVTVRRR